MSQSWKCYARQMQLASSMAIGVAIASPATDCAFAQSVITPDNTLGTESSRVVPTNYQGNPIELLTNGARRGNNLFHSFLELNVSQGRGAFFLSPDSNIRNIITRVTGSNPSAILGTLGTLQKDSNGNFVSSNANLFLINPNGIIFGPQGTLSLGGSFVGSTANAIKFADGTVFSATANSTTPLLTVSVPVGLQFGASTRDIQVQGVLAVNIGKTLALVGGNVNLDKGVDNEGVEGVGFLQAQGGQIAIGGILGEGTIGLNLDSNNLPLSFPDRVQLADVSLSNGSGVDVSGDGGGSIQVQGRRVTLIGASKLFADTLGSQNGRGISIRAEQLTIKDGSQVSASTSGAGTGGNLTVNASDSVQVIGTDADGNPSALFADTFVPGTGAAGNLTIDTRQLIIQNGANVSATTRSTDRQGRGGTLNVTASDSIKLSGTSAISGLPSGLFAQTLGSADAGSLTIDTPSLIVENGAQVTAGTGKDSRGNGGTLIVNASNSVELSGTGPNGSSGLFARSRGTGNAGSLKITTGQLIVDKGAQVTVGGIGSGNAGNLEIQARDVRLDQGKLTAQAALGQGGNITLQGLDLLLLRNNSQITTRADTEKVGADVAGGNIDINSKVIAAVPGENSDITATAYRGRGGNINITTQGIFGIERREQATDQTNDITASSQLGINGRIQINTPDVNPSRGIVALPAQTVDVSRQVASGCAAANGEGNTFVVTGRGGLPPNPYEPLSSDVVWSDTRLNVATQRQHTSKTTTTKPPASAPVEINPATGWVFNGKGEVTLISHAPNTTPSMGFSDIKCHTSQN